MGIPHTWRAGKVDESVRPVALRTSDEDSPHVACGDKWMNLLHFAPRTSHADFPTRGVRGKVDELVRTSHLALRMRIPHTSRAGKSGLRCLWAPEAG